MNRFLYGLLILLTTFLMGSAFAIGKIGLTYVSPLLLVALRFTIAGIFMAAAMKMMKRSHPKSINQWLQIAVVGFFQTAAVMGCIFLSLRTITSGESAILTFTNPLLVVLFGTVFLRTKYRLLQWIGVLIGFMGVFITMGGKLTIETGTFLGFMSAVAWSVATLLIKSWGPQLDTWVLTAYQMLFGGLFLFAASFLFEDPFIEVNAASIGILVWLAFMASIVQFAGWFYLLQTGDPGKTSAFLFLAPFFGILSGWVLLDENLHLYALAGGALIFTGIFLVNWQSSSSVKRK